jgi:hypothetical protein
MWLSQVILNSGNPPPARRRKGSTPGFGPAASTVAAEQTGVSIWLPKGARQAPGPILGSRERGWLIDRSHSIALTKALHRSSLSNSALQQVNT